MGRTHRGVDCIGLYARAAWDCGYRLDDTSEPYPRKPVDDRLLLELNARLSRVPIIDQVQPADLIVFYIEGRKRLPGHVGAYTESGGLIHAWADVGSVVEWTSLGMWQRRILAVYRLAECS